MSYELEKIDALEDNLEDSVEDLVEDDTKDISDKFSLEGEAPNLIVKVVETSYARSKLTKLSSFLVKNNLRKESYEVLKLAHVSALSDGDELKEKLKREVLNVLSEEYSENFVDWNYDTDFKESILELGFADLEKQFVQLMGEGLTSLEDLNMDEASEVLWAASGLTPEGHDDFDNNLVSLQDYQDENLNRQVERPGRDDVIEVREEIVKKFSEWFEYREPNFESLEELGLEDLISKIKRDFPDLSNSIDIIYEEWEEFLDSIPNDQKQLFEDEDYFSPDETALHTETSSPPHHEREEPVGTSGDLERFEESLYNKDYEDLQDYI